jgi:Ca2+-binding RTX toxin-like protein
VDSALDKVEEGFDQGFDSVETSLTRYTLSANLEALTYVGSSDFRGNGNELNNRITGGAGNDTLNGGLGDDILIGAEGDDLFQDSGGADRMSGGLGNDTYYVDNSMDVVIENAGEGTDMIYTSVDFSLVGQHVEDMRARGAAAISLTGNELDNSLTGNEANNTLYGGSGHDALTGAGGDDRLSGGDGNDQLDGGAGNDLLDGGDGDDRLIGGTGHDILIGGRGRDLMTGGAGADRFVFGAIRDMGTDRESTDVIYDFELGDVIDLTAIDAISGTEVNDAFRYIGTSNFTQRAGELRATLNAGRWDIMGDVDGDGNADFVITAVKKTGFVNTDFAL